MRLSQAQEMIRVLVGTIEKETKRTVVGITYDNEGSNDTDGVTVRLSEGAPVCPKCQQALRTHQVVSKLPVLPTLYCVNEDCERYGVLVIKGATQPGGWEKEAAKKSFAKKALPDGWPEDDLYADKPVEDL